MPEHEHPQEQVSRYNFVQLFVHERDARHADGWPDRGIRDVGAITVLFRPYVQVTRHKGL